MEWLRLVLRYAHLIGFALLLGGAIAQYLSGKIRINPAMLWGAGVQVVTGLAWRRRCAAAGRRAGAGEAGRQGRHRDHDLRDGVLLPQAGSGQYRSLPGDRRPDPGQRRGRRLLALTPTYQAYPVIIDRRPYSGHGRVTAG